jgi:hypothetical protein
MMQPINRFSHPKAIGQRLGQVFSLAMCIVLLCVEMIPAAAKAGPLAAAAKQDMTIQPAPMQNNTAAVGISPASLASNAASAFCTPPLCLDWTSTEADSSWSVAWGDYDNDGDLDLAIGNGRYTPGGEPNRLYRNDNGTLTASTVWSPTVSDNTSNVAWGDVDGDGDLDLAVGNNGQPTRIYLNNHGTLSASADWSSDESYHTTSVAWGDVDGDGDLDLAVGNGIDTTGESNCLYLNNNGTLSTTADWVSDEEDVTSSVAWGDVDGDGDLDLAVGNGYYNANTAITTNQPNRLYLNNHGTLSSTADWSSTESEATSSIAWGDVDGDGDLDLAVGNQNQPNRLYVNDNGTLTSVWQSNIPNSSGYDYWTYSVAWADYDGDGDLDLATGAHTQERLYRNDNGTLTTQPAWSSTEADGTYSIAWGDVDGDGDLDFVTGGVPRLYRNEGATLTTTPAYSTNESDFTTSVAWGDVDGDGDLDLAVGNRGKPDRLYRNDNGKLTANAVWSSSETAATESVAWGDVDGDGDLDLAVGNAGQPNRLYRNDNGTLTTGAVWSSDESDGTTSVAWGDYDSDGDLDLAVGNAGQPNRLYRNDNGTLTTSAVYSTSEADETNTIAWGDVDGDGDLDLAVGNYEQPKRLYRNDNGTLTPSAVWSSTEIENTLEVAWGDVDGDGDLDLASANVGQSSRIYTNNNGTLTTSATWSSYDRSPATSLAWGDYDGDGDLDLLVGCNYYYPNHLYRNDGGTLTRSAVWSSVTGDTEGDTQSVAWGDMDNDGDLDLATGGGDFLGAGQPNRVYQNTRDGRSSVSAPPSVSLTQPTPLFNANFDYTDPATRTSTIPLKFMLSDPKNDRVASIHAFYSPDGGGKWYPAVAANGTITTNLASNATYTYSWDTFASGFFGQSDNMVFRIEAYPSLKPSVNGAPIIQYPYASATTFPFRVRGMQVRVLQGSAPVSNAMVYRLPSGQLSGGELMADNANNAFRTDDQGYLSGRGALAVGDALVAMLPITTTEKYTLYYTSAAPTATGLNMAVIASGGVQNLTVSAANPLLVFNLSVSFEWDARSDAIYLQQFQNDMRRASEILYDWTNGQATLGEITLYHQQENWDDADIQILASNRYNPNADQGGVVVETITETLVIGGTSRNLHYEPGQLRQGATWNRYGESTGSLGEDWPRAMAHELGHYLLYLDDNYYGFDANGDFTPVTGCAGVMADPYTANKTDGHDEFHLASGWLPTCANTSSNRNAERPDWATVVNFYPWLSAPTTSFPGPSVLPLNTVKFSQVNPAVPSQALDSPYFSLIKSEGGTYQATSRAQAILIQNGRLLDLGGATLDQLMARGAKPGDRLCLFDLGVDRLGCKDITAGDNQLLGIASHPEWRPDIEIRPVTSTTLQITLTVAADISASVPVYAQLYPVDGPVEPAIQLTRHNGTEFSGTYPLSDAAPDATLHIWAGTGGARVDAISSYSLGGNPVQRRRKPVQRKRKPVQRRRKPAPVSSSDGNVVLHGEDLDFAQGEYYILQTATRPPAALPWTTVVGQAYRLEASSGAPSLSNTSLQFYYMRREVPPGEEAFLRVYYFNGQTWLPLDSTISTDGVAPYVVAPVQGTGMYVLMSSLDIPLNGPGWNLFAYPVNATRPISDALRSIDGYYTTVYGYDPKDTSNPWRVYAPGVPGWVNDLLTLEFGKGYWINVTQSITLWLKGGSQITSSSVVALPPAPPAGYYGVLPASLNPQVGATITAWIGGKQCGQAITKQVGSDVVFVVKVAADDGGAYSGCGLPGRMVTFKLGNRTLGVSKEWSTQQVYEIYATNTYQIFLPLIKR